MMRHWEMGELKRQVCSSSVALVQSFGTTVSVGVSGHSASTATSWHLKMWVLRPMRRTTHMLRHWHFFGSGQVRAMRVMRLARHDA